VRRFAQQLLERDFVVVAQDEVMLHVECGDGIFLAEIEGVALFLDTGGSIHRLSVGVARPGRRSLARTLPGSLEAIVIGVSHKGAGQHRHTPTARFGRYSGTDGFLPLSGRRSAHCRVRIFWKGKVPLARVLRFHEERAGDGADTLLGAEFRAGSATRRFWFRSIHVIERPCSLSYGFTLIPYPIG
jgi:hypothetical protein